MVEETPFPLWDDNPTLVDLLGFADLVEPATQALTRPNLEPVCVGVFGPWGAGKTSVAMQAERALEAREDVLVVYAEPWAFDPTTDPKARLIGIVLNAVNAHLNETGKLNEGLKKTIAKLAKRVKWSRAIRLAAKTALTAQLPSIDQLSDVFTSEEEVPVDEPSIEGFREEFATLMMDEALADVERLVVVIDDLDRCLPDTVVEILEAIKLFLSVPKMAFLVAADEKAVRFAIATRYATTRVTLEKEAMELAVRYLDKIVQIPIRVPLLSLADVEAYILQLLVAGRPDEGLDADAIRSHCDDRRKRGEARLLEGLLETAPGEDVILAERLAPVLYEGMDGNPRRVKRFLNEMWLRSVFAQARGIDVDHSAVAKLMVLEQVHEAAFEEMLEWVRAGTLDDKLTALQEGQGDASLQLSRWAEMEPRPLEPETVRQYLVLAASLRGSTIPTESLPPHLREIAGRLLSSVDATRRDAASEAKGMPETDRSLLAVHTIQALSAQPGRQPDLAEILADLAGSGPSVEASVVDSLRTMRVADLDVSLVVNLAPPGGKKSKPVAELLSFWALDPDLPEPVRRAIDQASGGAGKRGDS